MNDILAKARAIQTQIVTDRRMLHQIPEVGVYTPQTAAYIRKRLTEMGIPHSVRYGLRSLVQVRMEDLCLPDCRWFHSHCYRKSDRLRSFLN